MEKNMSDKNFPNNTEEDGIEIVSSENNEEDSVTTESSSVSVEENEKKPLPKKEIIRYILLGICVVAFIVSAVILIRYFVEQHKLNKLYDDIENEAIDKDDSTTEFVNEESTEYVFQANNDVDFDLLTSVNEDVRGWISFPLLGIEYPFVQGIDNDFYLEHAYNKEKASGGAIYMEYRLSPDFSDSHVVLYGHNMNSYDKSMFTSLLNYDDEKFYTDNIGEHLVYIYLPNNTVRVYEVFSVTDVTQTEHDLLFYVNLPSTKAYADYAKSVDLYDIDIDVTDDDQILTLFTCQYGGEDKERHMVHCRLVTVINK